MEVLKIGTWNARGVMPGAPYLSTLLKSEDLDICALCEHWLFPHSLHFLNTIEPHYDSFAYCDKDLCVYNLDNTCIRGKGGVAFVWKSKLSPAIKKLDTNDDRVIAIDIRLSSQSHLILLCAYLPGSDYTTEMFRDYINIIVDLVNDYSTYGRVIILGDMNVQINGPRKIISKIPSRGKIFASALSRLNMISLSVQTICSGPSYSFNHILTDQIDLL